MHRIKYAQGTLGCLTAFTMFLAPVAFLMTSFVDLSDLHHRGAAFFAFLQSLKIGDFPFGAMVIGLYLLYLGVMSGWRWSDGVALGVTEKHIVFHRSYFKKPITMEDLISCTVTRKTGGWIKALNPKLIFIYKDADALRESRIAVTDVDLSSPDSVAAVDLLKSLGKWIDTES